MSTSTQAIVGGAAILEVGMGVLILTNRDKLINPRLKRKQPPEVRVRRWVRMGYFYIAIGAVQFVYALAR